MRRQSPYDQGIFPDPRQLVTDACGFVGVGANLQPETLIEAYSKGYFPWEGKPPFPWYSPDPRLILDPHQFRISRSLRKVLKKVGTADGTYVQFDGAFEDVMRQCARISRPNQSGTWITDQMVAAYSELHRLGVAHCVAVYDQHMGLIGGLYGLTLGKAFFGESMFSAVPNASKVALAHLCAFLRQRGFAFIDCQQDTPHLRSLGAQLITRTEYLDRLENAVHRTSLHTSWCELTQTTTPLNH